MSNFIQDCLTGDAIIWDIDDYIDQWHEGDSDEPLYVYLGMTKDEYSWWLSVPEILPFIITAHKEQKDARQIFQREITAMAARSSSIEKANKLRQWLQQQGLWD